MRIALVQPPLSDFYLTHHRMSALGLAVVRELLESAGHDVLLYNFPLRKGSSTLPLPGELSHLAPYLVPGERGPLSGFSQFRRYGPDYPDAASAVLSAGPDLVLIGLFAWAYGDDALAMASALRRKDETIEIGIGGAGVSVDPERFRSSGLFDHVCTGEAEKGLGAWAGFEGDFLPAASAAPGGRSVSVSAGRGCPMRCRFCANRLVHGEAFRLASPPEVLSRVRRSAPGDTAAIYLEDDNLTADMSWFRELLAALHSEYPGAEISAENGIDYRFLDPGDLKFLRDNGFRKMNYSIASAEPAVRAAQDRGGGTLDPYIALLKEGERLGMDAVTYFIAGLPGETPAQAVDNLLFLSGLPTRAGISLFYPVPGIAGFEDPLRFRDVPSRRALGSAAWPWGGGCTTIQLLTAFRMARAVNLLKAADRAPDDRLLADAVLEQRALFTLTGKNRKLTPVSWADKEMTERFFREFSVR